MSVRIVSITGAEMRAANKKWKREEAVEKLERALELVEEAAEAFTPENGNGNPREHHWLIAAQVSLREVIGK